LYRDCFLYPGAQPWVLVRLTDPFDGLEFTVKSKLNKEALGQISGRKDITIRDVLKIVKENGKNGYRIEDGDYNDVAYNPSSYGLLERYADHLNRLVRRIMHAPDYVKIGLINYGGQRYVEYRALKVDN
jgi:hypothetical protein